MGNKCTWKNKCPLRHFAAWFFRFAADEIRDSWIYQFSADLACDGSFLGNLVYPHPLDTRFFSIWIYSYRKNNHCQCGYPDEYHYARDLIVYADHNFVRPSRKQDLVLLIPPIVSADGHNVNHHCGRWSSDRQSDKDLDRNYSALKLGISKAAMGCFSHRKNVHLYCQFRFFGLGNYKSY